MKTKVESTEMVCAVFYVDIVFSFSTNFFYGCLIPVHKSAVLRSRYFLDSAPAPPLSKFRLRLQLHILPYHFKLFDNSSYHKKYVSMEVFLHPSMLQTD